MSAGGGCGDHCQVQYINAGGDSQHQRQVVFAVAGGEFQGYGAAAALAAAGARAIVSL